jgi:translation initiation factor 2 beta subunit (eIF-2beta)/eIF-5
LKKKGGKKIMLFCKAVPDTVSEHPWHLLEFLKKKLEIEGYWEKIGLV